MKHIKLSIYSKEKLDKVANIFIRHSIKIQNNFCKMDDIEFENIKDEINNLNIGMSIVRNPDYVIIKEKMKMIPPAKYVTYKEFNEFKTLITDKVDMLDTKVDTLATTTYVDKKIDEVNSNILELFKIGLMPLYKKLNIKLPKQFK